MMAGNFTIQRTGGKYEPIEIPPDIAITGMSEYAARELAEHLNDEPEEMQEAFPRCGCGGQMVPLHYWRCTREGCKQEIKP